MTMSSSLGAEDRRARLLEVLEAEGRITITEATDSLGVSAMTLRRDLADLETAGQVRRVRGGAVATPGPKSFAERRRRHSGAKRVIAAKAARLIPPEGVCAFDASSTAGVLLASITDAVDLTVLTNSAENFEAASGIAGISPQLIGGHRLSTTHSFVGPLAQLAASAFTYRRFITSAAALDPEWGSSETTAEEAALKRTLVSHADSTVLLADSTKLGARAAARAVGLDDVDLLVTELEPADPRLDPYRDTVELL